MESCSLCNDRLLWRCRRGLLELDLVLEHFVVNRFDSLDPALQERFLELLELPDNELWDMITGKIPAQDTYRPLIESLAA